MPLPSLAQPGDVEARLGRELSSVEEIRVLALLDDASALVRAYTAQEITEATSTVRLRVRDGRVRLPQRPVSAVTAVADMDAVDLSAVWSSGEIVELSTVASWGVVPSQWVDVTYTHGYAEVPADIVGVVCDIVSRSFSGYLASPAIWQQPSAGINPEAIGAVIPTPALGGSQLTADQRLILDRYRRVVGTAYAL